MEKSGSLAPNRKGRSAGRKGEALFALNRERYGDRIREYRLMRGLKQPQLAKMLGVTKNAIPNWEAGRSRPDFNYIPALCNALGISIATFFGEAGRPADLSEKEQRLVNDFRLLSSANRRAIRRLMDTMIENEDRDLRERCKSGFERKRHSGLMASAGTGYDLDGGSTGPYVYVRIGREACRADEIITVSGDSMEPTFRNGDDLFVEHTRVLRPGEIGVFAAAGEGYVKEYRKDGLHSHNPAYPVIRFSDAEDVRCIGRVLGVVSKDQYATRLELEIIEDVQREMSGARG